SGIEEDLLEHALALPRCLLLPRLLISPTRCELRTFLAGLGRQELPALPSARRGSSVLHAESDLSVRVRKSRALRIGRKSELRALPSQPRALCVRRRARGRVRLGHARAQRARPQPKIGARRSARLDLLPTSLDTGCALILLANAGPDGCRAVDRALLERQELVHLLRARCSASQRCISVCLSRGGESGANRIVAAASRKAESLALHALRARLLGQIRCALVAPSGSSATRFELTRSAQDVPTTRAVVRERLVRAATVREGLPRAQLPLRLHVAEHVTVLLRCAGPLRRHVLLDVLNTTFAVCALSQRRGIHVAERRVGAIALTVDALLDVLNAAFAIAALGESHVGQATEVLVCLRALALQSLIERCEIAARHYALVLHAREPGILTGCAGAHVGLVAAT